MAAPAKRRPRSVPQLVADGFAALVERLGKADAIRYMQLHNQGAGDYTAARHTWLDSLSHAEVADLVAQAARKPSRKKR